MARSFLRRLSAVLPALPALLLLSACGPRESVVERGLREGVLHVAISAEPRALDPHTATGIGEAQVLAAVFEGLVIDHPETDGAIAPGAAHSWEVSADGLAYTFHLRPDARWSNGDPLTADHFRYAFHRILHPDLGSSYAEMLYPLSHAESFHRGETDDFARVGVAAPDDHTLVLTLASPLPHFLQLLRHFAWYPVHPPTIKAHDAFSRRGTPWTRPANFVGNGPFTLADWRVNDRIRVTANPHFHGAAEVRLAAIVFRPIENADVKSRAYEAGELHVANEAPHHRREYYQRNYAGEFFQEPTFATTYLLFNTAAPPLDDPRVRRALSLAVDRTSLTRDLLRSGEPATSFTPDRLPGYQPPRYPIHDPAEARRLLAEAGFPDGRGFPPLTFSLSTSDTVRITAEAIQEMWRSTLNIPVTLENMEWRVYLSTLDGGQFQVGLLAWYGDYLDAYSFLSVFRSGGGRNRAQWSHPPFDALLEESLRTPDPAARAEILAAAEDLLLQQAPIGPLVWRSRNALVHPSVRGWPPKLLDIRSYAHVYLAPNDPP